MEHIPVVQIDLSVPLKVPGKCLPSLGNADGIGTGNSLMAGDPEPSSQLSFRKLPPESSGSRGIACMSHHPLVQAGCRVLLLGPELDGVEAHVHAYRAAHIRAVREAGGGEAAPAAA